MSLDTLLLKVAKMTLDMAKDKAAMIWGVPKEIEKLQGTLQMINCVVEDAERKRVGSSFNIEKWLRELKDVVYEADDIFDLWKIRYEEDHPHSCAAGEPSVGRHHSRWSTRLPFISFFRNIALSHNIDNRIKEFNLKLEGIAKDKDTFGLVPLDLPRGHSVTVGVLGRDTSHVLSLDIVGTEIEDDTKELVELLTTEEYNKRANTGVLVLAIVGIGGIGKTTLAQKIFNHEKIKDEFKLKVWVCVSQDLKQTRLVRDIIGGAGGDHNNEESMAILIPKLMSAVRGRRLLLVLDDVWVENLWEDVLRGPLGVAAVGSRVIVTSRKTSVAQGMKAIKTHNMELMSLENGWSLLSKQVVRSEKEWEIEGLKEVGIKIIEKCGRLPLAIKTLGGVLCDRDNTSNEWEALLHSNSWSVDGLPEEVNEVLYISYLELPLKLKRCFLFLSPFPEDYWLERDAIVGMWIAEGLVKVEGEYSSLEEVGQSYFKQLISKSLLQPISSHKSTCVMHDLLRFLAQFLTRSESLCIEEANMQSSSNITTQHKLRHVSLSLSSSGEKTGINDLVKQHDSLRTLMVFNTNIHMDGLFSRFPPLLRVLNLRKSIPRGQELPESLVGLVHLRYLDVSATSITKLPKKLGKLKNLQFLLLHGCWSLVELPKSVVELPNLRRLSLPNPNKRAGMPVPVGVGRLESLRCLEGFVVQSNDSCGVWSSLKELQYLSHLTKLTVYALERVLDCDAARAAAIGRKPRLKFLHMSCTISWAYEATEEDMKRVEEIFEELQPPPSVETLKMSYYPGSMPPSWISLSAAAPAISSFSNLTRIKLSGWMNCKKLPTLGQLPNLVELQILNAPSVESIGSEFMGGTVSSSNTTGAEEGHASSSSVLFLKLKQLCLKSMNRLKTWVWGQEVYCIGSEFMGSSSGGGAASVFFPKLKELQFGGMPSLKAWAWGQEVRALSSLQKLTILTCGLEAIPEGLRFHATSLTHLVLICVRSLKSITNLENLTSLHVEVNHSLTEITDCPSLKTLTVTGCHSIGVVKNLPSLQTVKLTAGYWTEIDCLPNWLGEEGTAKPSRKLEIKGCSLGLMKMVCQKDGWQKIQHIDHVDIRTSSDDQYAIYTRTPHSFNTNYL